MIFDNFFQSSQFLSYVASLAMAWLAWMHWGLMKSESDVRVTKGLPGFEWWGHRDPTSLSQFCQGGWQKLIRRIADFDLIVNQLNDDCKVCSAAPLLSGGGQVKLS